MPQEFIPRPEITSWFKQFEILTIFLDWAEKVQLGQDAISSVLGQWYMPNDPILSEN